MHVFRGHTLVAGGPGARHVELPVSIAYRSYRGPTVERSERQSSNRRSCRKGCRLLPMAQQQNMGGVGGQLEDKLQEASQPVVAHSDQSAGPLSAFLRHPAVVVLACLAFGLVASDVNAEGSYHLLPRLVDQPVHAFVTSHVPGWWRAAVADRILSNIAISVGLAGWGACMVSSITANPKRGVPRVAVALAGFGILGGNAWKGGGDVVLVNDLKHFFKRQRPSDLLHSYAFPSGHTTSAVFVVGTLLFVLLPLTATRVTTTKPDGKVVSVYQNKFLGAIADRALPLWALATMTTASGRVLADVHWVSDTIAGTCLGVGLVSLTTALCHLAVTGLPSKEKA